MTHFLNRLNVLSGCLSLLVAVLLGLETLFHIDYQAQPVFRTIHYSITAYFVADIGLRQLIRLRQSRALKIRVSDLLILLPLATIWVPEWVFYQPLFVFQLAFAVFVLGRMPHISIAIREFKLNPTQLFIGGFLFVIVLGSLFLSLPAASAYAQPIAYIDALFLSMSAVCVTGLTPLDISIELSRFGHVILLVLMQIGGLGIMAISALFAIFMNKKISQMLSQDIQDNYLSDNIKDTLSIIMSIFRLTLVFEAVGAVGLFLNWHHISHMGDRWFYAIFHSVSAFCNAGFSLFSDSLVSVNHNVPTILIFSTLIILGGLGFPVIVDLRRYLTSSRKSRRLRLQTKLVIGASAALIVLGTLAIAGIEFLTTQGGVQLPSIAGAFFQSVTTRTAGFNSVDITQLHPATITVMMILMLIGASPASTGGGIKTMTLVAILAAFWSTLRGREQIIFFRRSIGYKTVLKALAILMFAATIILLCFMALLITESAPIFSLLFESISAFSTVGLSLDVTGELSKVGKAFIMIVMFVGRVGPLSIIFALSTPRGGASYKYPNERLTLV